MSFEIKYNFHPKNENGEYNKEEVKNGLIKVDSSDLDILAGKVFSLMAKRNVFVVNLEIFEMVQKPVFFKENQDGISIGKKKFKFDDGAKVLGEEDNDGDKEESGNKGVQVRKESQQDIQTLLSNPQVLNLLTAALTQNGNIQPHQLNAKSQRATSAPATLQSGEKILRHEFYYPEDEMFVRAARKIMPDLSFTHGKQYPILSEKIPKNEFGVAEPKQGLFYETVDDKGRKVSIRSNLFVLAMPKLIGDDEPDAITGAIARKNSDGLYWGGAEYKDMPDLRRR